MIRTVNRRFVGFVVVLALGTAGCAAVPSPHEDAAAFPLTEAEEVFAAGYGSIAEKYIDEISIAELAVEGLRGLSTIDPALGVAHEPDSVVLRLNGSQVHATPSPGTDDPVGWAHVTTELAAAGRLVSDDLRTASPEELYEAVFDGSLSALDIYSRYAGAEEANENRAKRDGFGGIGIRFKIEDGNATVTEVMPDTPAERAGIRVGDIVTQVGEVPVTGLDSETIVNQLRGPVRSTVEVAILRPDAGEVIFDLRRAHIVPPTVTASVDDGIVHMRISSFNQGTARSLSAQLAVTLAEVGESAKGVILDLRGNPGGLLKQSVEVADAFLVHGDIVDTRGRHPDSFQHYEATGGDDAEGLPMVVLVDGKSASAAEIVAAALQDRERAVVVGTASYGKGTVQTVVRLPNDGEITLTWSRFVTPSGYALHGLGVYPAICTSGIDGDTHDLVEVALARHTGSAAMLDDWRHTDIADIAGRRALRAKCPPERHHSQGDVSLARALIEDGSLYFQALDLTAITAQVPQ